MNIRLYKERGAVALFIVVFSALLITTITVAFVRIMVQNQQQASMIDLSKSALDSAYAGVEDAKRAIIFYRSHCITSDGELRDGIDDCVKLDNALRNGDTCDTLQKAGIVGDPDPVDGGWLVEQSMGDRQLKQAYTCVKVQLDTIDYEGILTSESNRLIPLKAVGDFDRVVIEWYSQSDLLSALSTEEVGDGINLSSDELLPKLSVPQGDTSSTVWPKNRPPIIRFQLIQHGDQFRLSDFDDNDGNKVNNSTVFLMPSTVTEDPDGTINLTQPRRSSSSDILRRVQCDESFTTTHANGQFACRAVIELPDPIGPSADGRTAYVLINQIYGSDMTFRVCLQSCEPTETVRFSSVQPLIDSTGRANDLFRRVRARVEIETSSIPPVQSAVDISTSLCKSFLVTDDASEFNPGSCF